MINIGYSKTINMPLSPNFSGKLLEVGTDEAGRGCLSGPVVAAAVILPENFEHPLLNDSKKLTEKQRKLLLPMIEKEAVGFGVTVPHALDCIKKKSNYTN